MAAKAKKKGLIYRLGYVYGWCSRRYLRYEEPVIRWGMKKGLPAALAGLMRWLIRLSLVGAFLFLAFGVMAAVIAIFVAKGIVINGSEIEEEDLVTFKADEVFPDPYSPENMNDPAFYREI
ncbi:DUF3742 family protein [Pseudomonas asplenii]|uniref:DUF3742 family protein n=1 Tax=Pseudomonas asplenii TaxID=53407 RepID=A0A1H6NXN5_9PSED|nr:DUF3742 family protein [Pseudomonas fuscovaginae]SEI21753.1 Protein of unknown function [Pseudomonas fuscovaginae]